MLTSKNKQILFFLVCIIFTITSVFSVVIAENHLHIDNCKIEECPLCTIILLANQFTSILTIMSFVLVTIEVLVYVQKYTNKENKQIKDLTLVDLKIELNN